MAFLQCKSTPGRAFCFSRSHLEEFMKIKVWVPLVALYIVWGSTYLAIRYAVETIPPFLAAGARFLISGLILYIWRRMAGDPLPTSRQWRSTAIVGLLLLVGGNGMVSWAEQTVPSGIAALIIGSVPMWMVLIEAIRPGGVKPNWQALLGLLIGFGGITLLVGPSNLSSGITHLNPFGVGALLLAAFLWSVGSIYSRSADLPNSSLMTTGMEMLVGCIGLFVVATLTGEWQTLHLAQVTTRSILGVLYLAAFGSLIGFVSYAWLLRNASVSLVSTYAYVNPVVAVLLGNWLAAEPLTARVLTAAVIIVGSVALINTARPGSKSKKEPVLIKDE
jgi:drug/metabolite transporter (DMT)-like permease